ncbi:MAG: hypothetical protein AAB074_13570 [Planctomycetota bacterium]
MRTPSLTLSGALLLLAAGCAKRAPPRGPTDRLATRFEERLASSDPFPETEALAFLGVLGPAAAAPLGRAPVSPDPSRRRFLANLLAAASQGGIRNEATFALSLHLSTDADAEVRSASRDAVLWSRLDADAARDSWMKSNLVVKSYGLDREYPLPRVEEALALLKPDVAESDTDPRIVPRLWVRMPPVRGHTRVDAYDGLAVGPQEKLCWVTQCARAGEPRAIERLEAYLEPEPNMELGRTPSEPEREFAFLILQAVPGYAKRR